MAVFVYAATHLGDDEHLTKYWPDGTAELQPFCKRFQLTRPSGGKRAAQARGGVGTTPKREREVSRLGGGGSGRPPVPPSPPLQPQVVSARSLSPLVQRPQSTDGGWAAAEVAAAASISSYAGAVSAASPPPARAGSAGGSGAVHSSLPQQQQQHQRQQSGAPSPLHVVVGYEVDGGSEPLMWPSFPQRPGQQVCDFYIKTGTCKYGPECCFDHPERYAVPLTELKLPFREGEPVCAFYLKTHNCKFGAACKFNHPRLRPIYAGSAAATPPSAPV